MCLAKGNISIPQKTPAIHWGLEKRKKSPKGYDNGIWGLGRLRKGKVGLFMNFVDFQFLKCISLVGGLKGILVRVSVVKE